MMRRSKWLMGKSVRRVSSPGACAKAAHSAGKVRGGGSQRAAPAGPAAPPPAPPRATSSSSGGGGGGGGARAGDRPWAVTPGPHMDGGDRR